MSSQQLWVLREEAFPLESIRHKETVFTIGNGYLSTRGTFEEGCPGELEATFLHGVFDDTSVVFTTLVNAPNWTSIEIELDGESFSMVEGQLLAYKRRLDLRTGLLEREVRWRSPQGRTVELHFRRFASLARQHIACLRIDIRPVDFSGAIQVKVPLNGFEDTLGQLHWQWRGQQVEKNQAVLHLQTGCSEIDLALAARLVITGAGGLLQEGWDVRNHPVLVAAWQAEAGQVVTVEKIVALVTSRDVQEPVAGAMAEIAGLPLPAWDLLEGENRARWEAEWSLSDVIIEGDDEAQLALRFNLFQLLIAAPRRDERVSIGAKTLSGYGYRGHVFWDTEIFILPFFTCVHPGIARNLLSYRWHTLPGARKKAHQNGYVGAQYAWESAATGEEVTPVWVPHPTDRTQLIRIWTSDIEIHISADIAYALVQYWKATGDDVFLCERGAEIILSTARFWASRAEWVPARDRYEFTYVIGPDEYHDRIDNNAYTNYLACWHLREAADIFYWLLRQYPDDAEALSQRLGITPAEMDSWQRLAEQIYLPFNAETGMIEQFEGYFQRKDISLLDLEPRFQSCQSLFGIEGVAETQIIKQPDVLMLFYLFPDLFDERTVQANYAYYSARTDHTYGSSLGPAIQSILACWMGHLDEAYEHFIRAARVDLLDVRGNAEDGIHGASAGGLWQAVAFGFAGLKISDEGWEIKPCLPAHWKRLSFKFFHRGRLQQVDIHNQP